MSDLAPSPALHVIVVGAGPSGLVVALRLAQDGANVTLLEREPRIPRNLRGSTFHPSTLDLLEDHFGAATQLRKRGIEAPKVQYRRHGGGPIAEFDFSELRDVTNHPFRVQAEQFKLCEVLHDQLAALPNATIRFGVTVADVRQDAESVTVQFETDSQTLRADFVIGADGASSQVRRAAGIAFEGFTWPERFLVVSTPFNFQAVMPDLADVTYVADPDQWYFLLKVPALWRVMFPIGSHESDCDAEDPELVQRRLQRVLPQDTDYPVAHLTLYKVHQRVAKQYRDRRIILVGDAAHVNNPLGGMGMNGGIHDAFNLAEKFSAVLSSDGGSGSDAGPALDRYEAERRAVALEYVQRVSIQNKRDLEATGEARDAFEHRLRTAAADPAARRDLLMRLSMLASLQREA